ncbi:MAG: class I SAM-dependent methyltransferase [Acidobacteria bacterium]|nr:MAG: class I SAM-dependent methyltransferase [Acidobacteriota bacterium]REJ99326.1 MAG: class I SAM-dependent methyltransferase [Acidobacteriota bacterium]REK15652.1 MAG: class I SAM-dependent methyltransferase [Acidobacteriota bacterium]REK43635.1 MAG: class I SAM-dependent methyltransferase [Acidobacteriota bacterium]
MSQELSKEMQGHTYAIMNDVEDSHWWFVGRRAILESFMREIVDSLRTERKGLRTEEGRATKDPDNANNDLSGNGGVEADSQSSVLAPQSLLKILDVGCGTGANLEMLSEFGESEGVDVSDEALTFCKSKGLTVHKGLAEELPFNDAEFDIVTGLDVIEHLDDDVAGLSEMNRVTRPGGYALVFVPAFMWLWGVQDDISNHRIRYTKKQIVERLKMAGYVVERATYANITFFLPILGGRTIMRLTGIKPESENNVNVSALNGIFGKIFSSERHFLKHVNFPLGVSIVVVARKSNES